MGLRALDQASEAVFIAAPDGAIVYANQAARAQWGLSGMTFSLALLLANVAPTLSWQTVVDDVPRHQLIETILGDFWLSTEPYRASDANFIKITIQSAQGTATPEEASPSRQHQLLLDASRAIAATWEQPQVIEILVRYAQSMGGAAGAIFYQYDQVKHQLTAAYGLPRDGAVIEDQAIIGQEMLDPLSEVLFDFAPLVLTDSSAEAWPTPAAFGTGPFQILMMALTLHEEPYGILALFQDAAAQPFSAALQTTLEILLSHTGLAVENARLFTDTYQRESFSNALGRVSLATSATLDLDSVLNPDLSGIHHDLSR